MDNEIIITKKTGNERFIGIEPKVTLVDYWSYAHSDILLNAERGKVAEFLVATALGVQNTIGQFWDSFDLLSKENIKIEVKSSAYLQSWYQAKHSGI